MAESLQHKTGRVRPPRVQISYDVETEGAMRKIELPFVVGILADLSAQRKEPLPPLKQRRFVPIDRDNFHQVLERAAPRIAMKVQNKLTDEDTKLAVELTFKHLKDFDPARVAEQVPVLNDLLTMRRKLTELLAKMEGNDALEKLLSDVIGNADKALALAKEMGVSTPESPKTENS